MINRRDRFLQPVQDLRVLVEVVPPETVVGVEEPAAGFGEAGQEAVWPRIAANPGRPCEKTRANPLKNA